MLKVENIETYGWEAAIRGMRNPMNSWEKSDTEFIDDPGEGHDILGNYFPCIYEGNFPGNISLGENDQKLMESLVKGGPVHAKFRRMINITMDITAPLYWWKEFDTYKVGTVANSCSTMHKIQSKEFTVDDFSCEHLIDGKDIEAFEGFPAVTVNGNVCFYSPKYFISIMMCDMLNHYRKLFLTTNDKKYWWQMIQLLPSSYNQKRTVQMNYEVAAHIYPDRKDHKLDEWHVLCDKFKKLPYSWLITGEENRFEAKVIHPGDDKEADIL